MNRKERADAVYDRLLEIYGPQKCFLDHMTPFQLLIATILSAQCTDKTVNKVTPVLFKKWPGPAELAKAPLPELEAVIHPCGFFHAKGKNILSACKVLVEEFNGEVPCDMDKLTTLPGVGRKTANVVLGDSFDVPGFPVDTHVTRITQRMGLTRNSDPVKIESDICAVMAPEKWAQFSHLLIIHGRSCCRASAPDCETCPAKELCAHRKAAPKKG